MAIKFFILFAATVAISYASDEIPSIQDIASKVSLPPALEGKVDLKDLESVQNKTIDEIRSRCEKNGGPDAFLKAQNASQELSQCVSRLVNTSSLQQEIEAAKPNGDVDEVFKKYCEKKPLFEGCIKNFTDTSKACFSEKEQRHLVTVYNVSQQLADFICFKEGDRIALFIAEGGQECFQDKQEGLMKCANSTVGTQEPFDINNLANLTITFDEKQCNQILELQKCVVDVLMTCPKPTSANIVESLFKYIRKSTPCRNYPTADETEARSQKAENEKGGATTFFVTSATLITAIVAHLLF